MAVTLTKEEGLKGRVAFKDVNGNLVCLLESDGFPSYMTKEGIGPDDKKLIEDTIDELCANQ